MLQGHRRREVPQNREIGLAADLFEDQRLLGLREPDDTIHHLGAMAWADIAILAIRPDESETHRHEHRLRAGSGRTLFERLAKGHDIAVGRLLIAILDGEGRRAGLMIPERETREIGAGRVLETGQKGFDRRGLAIVPIEIEIHPGAEALLTEKGGDHADQFGALVIDRRRVEVVDLAIFLRPDGMLERPLILGKLQALQAPHRADALDGSLALVGREFLVAIDRQAFLQAELEPVAAGDAVAGPVVKIFMRDDGLDAGIVLVGGRVRVEEHVFVVEDVETLVLHRPHVEVGNRHDVEDVEIVFPAEAAFVPCHRPLQRVHGVDGLGRASLLRIDAERHMASARGREAVRKELQVAGDHGEEIGRLVEGVIPDRIMATAFELTGIGGVAVGQEDGRCRPVGLDPHAIGNEDVRAIVEIGDAAEAFRLALGAPDAVRAIKPHQLGVVFRNDLGRDRQ